MKKTFLIILFTFLTICCFSQQLTYINIKSVGISPPNLESTLIARDSNFYHSRNDTFTWYFKTDSATFENVKTFVEHYDYGRQVGYGSSYGCFLITLGTVHHHNPIIKETYILSNETVSKPFFKSLYKELTDKGLDRKVIHQINYYVTTNLEPLRQDSLQVKH